MQEAIKCKGTVEELERLAQDAGLEKIEHRYAPSFFSEPNRMYQAKFGTVDINNRCAQRYLTAKDRELGYTAVLIDLNRRPETYEENHPVRKFLRSTSNPQALGGFTKQPPRQKELDYLITA